MMTVTEPIVAISLLLALGCLSLDQIEQLMDDGPSLKKMTSINVITELTDPMNQ